MLSRIKNFLQQNIVPNLYTFLAEKILRDRIRKLEEKEFNVEINKDQDTNEFIEELKEYHQKEVNRKKIIEDKAKASLFIIVLSTTLILGSLGFIEEGGVIFKFHILLILIIGVIYLLLSGITSIKALNIRKFYDVYLDNRVKETKGKLNVLSLNKEDRISQLYKIIKLNQLMTIIRSNYVYATFVGIRNGIILISLFFVIVVCNVYFGNLAQPNRKIENQLLKKSIVDNVIKQNGSANKSVDRIIRKDNPIPDKKKRQELKIGPIGKYAYDKFNQYRDNKLLKDSFFGVLSHAKRLK